MAEDKKEQSEEPPKDQKSSQDNKEDEKKPDKPQPPKLKWPWYIAGIAIVVFVAFVLYQMWAPRPLQETNDAYVTAHFSSVAPRVGGQVVAVQVSDNQFVHAGELLVALDDRDFQTAVSQTEAGVASAQAQVAQARAQVERQYSTITKAKEELVSDTARLELARTDAARYSNLAATGAGTDQQGQQARVTLRQSEAADASARSDVRGAEVQLAALQAQLDSALAQVTTEKAQLAQARLNLSYTRVLAPIAGTVDQRSVQVGNFLSPGAPIMVVVPLDEIYIMANYREVALRHMRPGQPVTIHIDAYQIDLNGIIDSLPAASGAAYAPIPPNNSTGNFTKIVQRFPVKILFLPQQPLVRLVRVGMSAETTVDTHLDDIVSVQSSTSRRVSAREELVSPAAPPGN